MSCWLYKPHIWVLIYSLLFPRWLYRPKTLLPLYPMIQVQGRQYLPHYGLPHPCPQCSHQIWLGKSHVRRHLFNYHKVPANTSDLNTCLAFPASESSYCSGPSWVALISHNSVNHPYRYLHWCALQERREQPEV